MRRGSVAIVGEPCQGTRYLYIRLSTCCKNESKRLAIQIDRLTLLLFGEGSDSHAWYLGFCHLYLFAGHDSRPSGLAASASWRRAGFAFAPAPRVNGQRLIRRSGFQDLLAHLALELLEVLGKEPGELFGLLVVSLLVRPGATGVEDARRDAGDFFGDVEAKDGMLPGLDVVEFARYRRPHHRARLGDVYAVSHPVGSTRPPGVDQVAARAVLAHPLGEHSRVDVRRQG